MARLCKHGTEIGRVELLTSVRAYMSDGTIMENRGHGWKIRGKLKTGVTPQSAYERMCSKLTVLQKERPALTAYRTELHDLAPVSKRWKLHQAISLMPNDSDGVWSHVCDDYSDNIDASVDEIASLCRTFRVMEIEARELAKEAQSEHA